MREEVLLSHDHWIAGGTGLLETAVRLTKQGLKRVGHARKRSGIHRDSRGEASAYYVVRKRELKRFGAVALQHTARGAFVRETQGLDFERSAYAVAIGAGLSLERDIGGAGEFVADVDLHEPASAL